MFQFLSFIQSPLSPFIPFTFTISFPPPLIIPPSPFVSLFIIIFFIFSTTFFIPIFLPLNLHFHFNFHHYHSSPLNPLSYFRFFILFLIKLHYHMDFLIDASYHHRALAFRILFFAFVFTFLLIFYYPLILASILILLPNQTFLSFCELDLRIFAYFYTIFFNLKY